MSLPEIFASTCQAAGDRTALIDSRGRAITFAALAERGARLATHFHTQGIEPGDRVLLAVPLGHDLYASLLALWRLGAVAVFPEPALGLSGLRHAVHATAPKAFLSSGWYRLLRHGIGALRRIPLSLRPSAGSGTPPPQRSLNDEAPALISFTSGSTGIPKAIERTHGFLKAQYRAVAPLLTPPPGTLERDMVAFPVFVLVNLGLGITSVLPPWPLTRPHRATASQVANACTHHAVTRLLAPPTICEILAREGCPAGLRSLFTGGGPVFPDTLQRLMAQAPHLDITAVYGSTEAEPIAHLPVAAISSDDWQAMQAGAGLLAGSPIPEITLRLEQDEVLVSGDHVNESYLDPSRDKETKVRSNGQIWHRTGDCGHFDSQGRLWLLGRHGRAVPGPDGPIFPFQVETRHDFGPVSGQPH